MGSEQRIDSLTGIRGAAALLVVYSHFCDSGFLPTNALYPGATGVIVFFTLSGFLMAFLYAGKPFSQESVTRYAIARCSRIAPAYLTVVVASYLIYSLIDSQFIYAIAHQNLLRHLLFSGNVSALWSIPPEVQFYMVFVAIWFALWKLHSQRNPGLLAVLLIGLFLVMAYRARMPGTFVGATLQYFCCGAAFGILRSRVGNAQGDGLLGILQLVILGLIGVVLVGKVDLQLTSGPDLYHRLESALFAGIFVFLFSFDALPSRLLFSNRAIMMCGECSFSLYLLNPPLINGGLRLLAGQPPTPMVAALITLVILTAAWAMYRMVELTGSALLRRTGSRLLQPRQTPVNVP